MVSVGLRDWLLQRVTALVLLGYIGFLVGYFLCHPLSYVEWKALFGQIGMRYATVGALVSIVIHAWIGMWTITTDYLKCLWVRMSVQGAIMGCLGGYLVWGIQNLWSV